jgi:Tfp pilus assembly protein PilX
MTALAGRSGIRAGGQAGFSLVAAVFLIVVLAALGAFAVQVAMSQYQSANLELLEARAQAAAEAGIQYGANLALQTPPRICAAPNSYPFVLTQGALKGFTVTVTCKPTTHQIYSGTPPAAQNWVVYTLASTASYGTYGRPDYVARRVTRNVTLAPP